MLWPELRVIGLENTSFIGLGRFLQYHFKVVRSFLCFVSAKAWLFRIKNAAIYSFTDVGKK